MHQARDDWIELWAGALKNLNRESLGTAAGPTCSTEGRHRHQGEDSGTVVEKSFSNQKVASSIPCRSVLEQDTEPLIAPDVQL